MVVDIEAGEIEMTISTQQKFSHLLALHPNGRLAYTANIKSNSVSVFDLVEGKLVSIISCGNGAEGIDVSPNGKEMWVSNNLDNSIYIVDTKLNRVIDTLYTEDFPLRVRFTLDGKMCFVSNFEAGSISIFDAEQKKLLKVIRFPGKYGIVERILYPTPTPIGILMHPNGRYAFISNSNANKIEIIDLERLTAIGSIPAGYIPDGMSILE